MIKAFPLSTPAPNEIEGPNLTYVCSKTGWICVYKIKDTLPNPVEFLVKNVDKVTDRFNTLNIF